jgi:hypothetical protein
VSKQVSSDGWGERPLAGRAVRARLVADPRTGMPVIEMNQDDLAWACALKQFEPKPPKPPTF